MKRLLLAKVWSHLWCTLSRRSVPFFSDLIRQAATVCFQFRWGVRTGVVVWGLALGLPLVVWSVATPPPPEDIQARVRYVPDPSSSQGFTPVTFSYNFTSHKFRIETSLPIQSCTLQPHAPLDPAAFPNCPLVATYQGVPGNDWKTVPECLAPLCVQRGVRLTCQTNMGEI